MTTIEFIAVILSIPLLMVALYVGARLVTHAYFSSKRDYNQHNQENN